MVRLKLSLSPLVFVLATLIVAPPAHAAASAAAPAAPRASAAAPIAAKKPAPVVLDWRARLAIALKDLQARDPARLADIEQMQPRRGPTDELVFHQPELQDPRAAAVLLRRLMQGTDPVKVRCAIVEALPATGGDWQEGAAALVGIDSSPVVRKKLVEAMRYAAAPHAIVGLKLGFKDEDPEVNIAAARTAAFSRSGPELHTELYSSTFDNDWDLRAAAVQALGMLKLPGSRDVLIKALRDEQREVRLQALLALEQLDPDGLILLPELEELARDRKSHRIARKAELLLRKRRLAERSAARARRKQARPPAAPPVSPDEPPELMDIARRGAPPANAGKTAAP